MCTLTAFNVFVFICYSSPHLGNSEAGLEILTSSPVSNKSIDLPPWVAEDGCKHPEEECQLEVPGLGPNIDLSPLRHPFHYSLTSDTSNTTLLLNICEPLRDSACPDDGSLGACLINEGNEPMSVTPAGTFSRKLFWDRGLVKMVYGTEEVSGMITVFVFPCDPEETGTGRYSMTHNIEMLQFEVVWYTNLTCLLENHGIFRTDYFLYNMSSLTKLKGNYYEVFIEESKEFLYFNLFKALPLHLGNCDPGTMACLSVTGIDDVPDISNLSVRGVDLGRKIVLFRRLANYTVELVYGDGDQCPFCPYTKLSTRFLLFCAAQEGGPQVAGMAEDNCQLVIEWHSRKACPVNITYLISSSNTLDNTHQITGGFPNISSELYPESPGRNSTSGNTSDVLGDSKTNSSNIECLPTEADVLATCGVPLLATGIGSFITGLLLTFCCLALYYCLCLPMCCRRGARCCRTGVEPGDSCCCGLVGIQTATPSASNRPRDTGLESRKGRGGCSVREARASRLAKLTSPAYRSHWGSPDASERFGLRTTPTSAPSRARLGCL